MKQDEPDEKARRRALDEWATGFDDPLGRVLDAANRVYLIDEEEAAGLETLDVMAYGNSLLEAERSEQRKDWARGRKPRRAQAATSTLGVRLTLAERELIDVAALPESKAEFIRRVLLAHIELMVREPEVSERLLEAYQRYLDE